MRCAITTLVLCSLAVPVVMAAEIHVAPDGDDGAATPDAATPLRTISRACELASPGDSVVLHAGVYRETIRPQRSGTAGDPIIFRARREPGGRQDRVVISAFDPVVANSDGVGPWIQSGDGSWRIQLTADHDLGRGRNLVMVDGEVLAEARWPNGNGVVDFDTDRKAWSDAGGDVDGTVGPDTGYHNRTIEAWYDDDALAVFADGAWNDAMIDLSSGYGWVTHRGHVTAFQSGKVTFRRPYDPDRIYYAARDGDPYYLWGALVALDAPGEAFFDCTGNSGPRYMLYCRPFGGVDPSQRPVAYRARLDGIDLSGRSFIEVDDIELFGCRVKSDDASSDCRLRRLTSRYGVFSLMQGGRGGAVELDGSRMRLEDSDIIGVEGKGVSLGSSSRDCVVDNCVIVDVLDQAVSARGRGHRIERVTGGWTGSHVITWKFQAGMVRLCHVYEGGHAATDLSLINAHSTGDLAGTEVCYNWAHDHWARKSSDHAGWNGGMGIRMDSGGGPGVSNGVIHHNVIWNLSTSRCIVVWALQSKHENYGDAKIKVYHNTCDEIIGITIKDGSDATGIDIRNNIAASIGAPDDPPGDPVISDNLLTDSNRAGNLTGDAGFVSSLSRRYDLASHSSAIDAGVDLAPWSDGFTGSAPDLGAFEFDRPSFIPGAMVLASDLPDLQPVVAWCADGSFDLVLDDLPVGRALPQGSAVRLGDVVSEHLIYTYDMMAHQAGIRFHFTAPSPVGTMPVAVRLGDGDWTPLAPTVTVTSPTPRLTGALLAGDQVAVQAGALPLRVYDRLPVTIENSGSSTVRTTPVALLVDTARLIADGVLLADGRNLRVELGDGRRLRHHVDSGWNSSHTLLWIAPPVGGLPDVGPATGGDSGLYLQFGPADWQDSAAGREVLLEAWPMLGDDDLALWLHANDLASGPIANWPGRTGDQRAAGQPEASRRPDLVAGAMAGLPAVGFDGVDDLLSAGDFGVGPTQVALVYRSPDPGTTKWQRLLSTADLGEDRVRLGLPNSDGIPTPQPMPKVLIRTWSATSCSRDALTLGAEVGGGNHFRGEIGSLLVYSRELSNPERYLLSQYLQTRYRLDGQPRAVVDPADLEPGLRVDFGGVVVRPDGVAGDTVLVTVPDAADGMDPTGIVVVLPGGERLRVMVARRSIRVRDTGPGEVQWTIIPAASSNSFDGDASVFEGLDPAFPHRLLPREMVSGSG